MTKYSDQPWQFLKGAWNVTATAAQMIDAAATKAEIKRLSEEAGKPPHPTEGMASIEDLEQYRYHPGSFYFGRIDKDHDVDIEAGIDDDRHLFIMAGSRAGKGTSFIVQNAIRWPGPLLMIDPKGEAASITGIRRGTEEMAMGTGTSVRHFLCQKVAIIDPFNETKGPAKVYQTGYNPFIDINMEDGGGVRSIRAIASSIVTQEQGNSAHFSETAETVIAGLIEAMLVQEELEDCTLPKLRRKTLMSYDGLKSYLDQVATTAGLATEAWSVMNDLSDDEWSGHKSTLSRNLRWIAEPAIQENMGPSDFSLREAVKEGWSIYIVLPPELIEEYKAWLRVLVRVSLSAKMSLGTNQKGPHTLFLLDEFAALGRLSAIEKSAGYMAGYNIKLVPVIQNIGQVKDHYDKNWETFLGNAGAIIAFALNDDDSEVYTAKRLGNLLRFESSVSSNAGGGPLTPSAGHSVSQGWHERPIRFPNEIHEQGAREQMRAFIIPASGKGFMVERMDYQSDPALAQMFDSPDFINEWESLYE